MDTAISADSRGGDAGQLVHVEAHSAQGHLALFIIQESAACECKQPLIGVPVRRRVWVMGVSGSCSSRRCRQRMTYCGSLVSRPVWKSWPRTQIS
jgi:hypothetical protein